MAAHNCKCTAKLYRRLIVIGQHQAVKTRQDNALLTRQDNASRQDNDKTRQDNALFGVLRASRERDKVKRGIKLSIRSHFHYRLRIYNYPRF